jgi:hypothetical protein
MAASVYGATARLAMNRIMAALFSTIASRRR